MGECPDLGETCKRGTGRTQEFEIGYQRLSMVGSGGRRRKGWVIRGPRSARKINCLRGQRFIGS